MSLIRPHSLSCAGSFDFGRDFSYIKILSPSLKRRICSSNLPVNGGVLILNPGRLGPGPFGGRTKCAKWLNRSI